MAIDPSIPLAAGQIGANAGGNFDEGMRMYGQMLQQRQLKQQINSRNQLTQILQGAYDPKTGSYNQQLINEGIANNPGITLEALPFIQQVQQNQNAQLENQTKQFELARKKAEYIGQTLGPYVGRKDVTQQEYMTVLARARKAGMLTDDEVMEAVKEMPSDPIALGNHIDNLFFGAASPEVQAQFIKPEASFQNFGSYTGNVVRNPRTGEVTQVQQFQNTMSPGESNEMVQIYGPDGIPRFVTRQQAVQMTQGTPPGQQGTPAQGNGRYQYQPGQQPQQPMQGQQPAQQQPMGLQAGPAPGQVAGAEVIAKGGAERFNALQTEAANVRNAVAGYDGALKALDALGTSGPGLDNAMMINGALEAFGLPVNADANANWQTLNKYLSNAGATAAAAAGYGGSDAGRALFGEGQPSAKKMTPQALREAILYVRAQQLGVLAKQGAATAWAEQNGNDYGKYSQFETKWNKAYNPDAMYMESLSDPAAQSRFYNSLSKEKRAALEKSYDAMAGLGAFN